jgi:hypothetical protein
MSIISRDHAERLTAKNLWAEERALLGRHVAIELLDQLIHVLSHLVGRSVEQRTQRDVLDDVLFDHPLHQQCAPGTAAYRLVKQYRQEQLGLGPVVLAEIAPQPREGDIELDEHGIASMQSLREQATPDEVSANSIMLHEKFLANEL